MADQPVCDPSATMGPRCPVVRRSGIDPATVMEAARAKDPPPGTLRTKLCRHFQRGRCFFGDNCRFLHAMNGASASTSSRDPQQPEGSCHPPAVLHRTPPPPARTVGTSVCGDTPQNTPQNTPSRPPATRQHAQRDSSSRFATPGASLTSMPGGVTVGPGPSQPQSHESSLSDEGCLLDTRTRSGPIPLSRPLSAEPSVESFAERSQNRVEPVPIPSPLTVYRHNPYQSPLMRPETPSASPATPLDGLGAGGPTQRHSWMGKPTLPKAATRRTPP